MYSPILSVFLERDSFFKYKEFLLHKHILPKEIFELSKYIEEYYLSNTSIDSIDISILITKYKVDKYSKLSQSSIDIYDKIFNDLLYYEPDDDELNSLLYYLIEKDYATKIADLLLRIHDGDDTVGMEDAEDMLSKFREDVEGVREQATIYTGFEDDDFEDLHDYTSVKGLEWRLEELNVSAGPIRGGDFIIITANPDAGKTTFLCAESTHMMKQLDDDQVVFWANNEERKTKVKRRITQSLLGMTQEDMKKLSLMELLDAVKTELGGLLMKDRFVFYDQKLMRTKDIELMLSKINPGLIIFDQLWKIDGFHEAHSEVDKMTKLFGWARAMADKHNCPVINVHQASGDAYGEAYIGMEQMYNSRVGIQGEADLIVGIGKVTDPSVAPNTRFLNISKNKLDGGDRTQDHLRNGKFEIEIDPYRVRFNSFV